MDNSLQIIQFNKDFYNTIKGLKSFIKGYFLEVHKGIKIIINPNGNKVRCEINFGRHAIKMYMVVLKIEGFTKETSLCLDIEDLEKYGRLDPEIKVVIQSGIPNIYVNNLLIPLKSQSEEPDMSELPFVNELPNAIDCNSLLSGMCQKENLLTLDKSIIYEKISDYLYRVEEDKEGLSLTLSYEDLKMLSLMCTDESVHWTVVPRYYVFECDTCTVYVLKYKPDLINKQIINRKRSMGINNITNALIVDVPDLKRVVGTLNLSGDKSYGLLLGKVLKIGNSKIGYPIKSESKQNITNQQFIIDKSELNLLLKVFKKEEKLIIVAGKDFLVVNKKFVLLMRSIFNE